MNLIKENKKELIETLTKERTQLLNKLVILEAQFRNALTMWTEDAKNTDLNNYYLRTKQQRKEIEGVIKYLTEVINDIQEDKLILE